MIQSTQCLGSVVPLAMFVQEVLKIAFLHTRCLKKSTFQKLPDQPVPGQIIILQDNRDQARLVLKILFRLDII